MSSYDLIAITGVSRGPGSVLRQWLIDQGKTIAGCVRSQEALDELSDQVGLDGQHSGESATVPLPGYVL
jgi:NADP-dependent 3-hydroxy acid dehydrogenase YdfG